MSILKSFPVFLLCAIAFIAIVAVQPVMAVVDMDPFDSSVPEASLNPFSNDIAEPTGTYDWFYGPDQTQMSDYLAELGIPYYDDSGNWVIDPAMRSTGGSTWDPNANFEVPKLSPALPDWSGEYVPQVGTGGWYSPLTPSGIPVSPTRESNVSLSWAQAAGIAP